MLYVDIVFCPSLESCFGSEIHFSFNLNLVQISPNVHIRQIQISGPGFESIFQSVQFRPYNPNFSVCVFIYNWGLYYYNILCYVLYIYCVSIYIDILYYIHIFMIVLCCTLLSYVIFIFHYYYIFMLLYYIIILLLFIICVSISSHFVIISYYTLLH